MQKMASWKEVCLLFHFVLLLSVTSAEISSCIRSSSNNQGSWYDDIPTTLLESLPHLKIKRRPPAHNHCTRLLPSTSATKTLQMLPYILKRLKKAHQLGTFTETHANTHLHATSCSMLKMQMRAKQWQSISIVKHSNPGELKASWETEISGWLV